ncbi:hypothetical protein XENOCAPTIV_020632 [Xenoophorus captivus]|uniref:Up-frameshift suppressor 2 C-terminal domain-containing protein n=1 Tax=Xenoophorus captivus TaxID=1517983 RepID=A0ABV0Q4M5_9TELE
MSEGEPLDEEDEDEDDEGAADTEEQSGNESEMNEQEEDQRSGEAVKVHQLDVAIPLQLKSQLKKGGSGQQCMGEGDSDISDTMQFVMLTRKGNKQQYKILNVPLSSHLAANHFNQQQAEQEERMRMKKLTLDINERQEQEDYQGTQQGSWTELKAAL